MWDGWEVSHVSVEAAVKMLDKYGEVFELKSGLIIKQQLAELEKKHPPRMEEKNVTSTSSENLRSKNHLLSVMGLFRVEEVDAMVAEANHKRDCQEQH